MREIAGGYGADVVIQCVGSAAVDEQAIAMGGPGGRVVLIGDAQIEGTHTSRLAPVGDHRIRGIARIGGVVMLLLDANRLMALPLFAPR